MSSQPTLLHIDASPRGERSKSRLLGRDFLARWRDTHATGRVIARDVGQQPPPFVTEAWVEGAFVPADRHSPEAKAAIAISNQYVDELLAADQVVITTPIYNLSIPAALKAWIDQIVRVGRTFAVTEKGYQGLVSGKQVLVLVASGGDFRPHTPGGAYNFLEPYLRAVFGFIGITDVRFVYAQNMSGNEAVAAEALRAASAAAAEIAAA